MAWTWQLETADGTVVGSRESVAFPSRGDAESWIGEEYQDLADEGVDQVRLFEDGREVYGPMSLHAS